MSDYPTLTEIAIQSNWTAAQLDRAKRLLKETLSDDLDPKLRIKILYFLYP